MQGRWSLNVWAGILGDQIIGPEFIEGHVNAENYSHFLQNRLHQLLDNVPLHIRRNMYFQQDGHPAHTSLQARTVLNREYPDRWIGLHGPQEWPPRSPDLTPMDFFLWGYIEGRVYKTLPNDRADLIARIRAASADITPEMLRIVRKNFTKRVAFCLEEDGGLFVQLL